MKSSVSLVSILILMVGLCVAVSYVTAQPATAQSVTAQSVTAQSVTAQSVTAQSVTAHQAFQVVPVGIQAQDGVYVLTISGGGVTSIVPLQIISVDGVPPIQPPTTPGTVLSSQAMAVRAAALTVNDPKRSENALKLAAVYDKIKETVDNGEVSGQANIAVIIQKVSSAILGTEVTKLWKPVLDVFAAEWTSLVQDGASDGELGDYLGEASKGLKSVGGNQAISPQWIEIIMMIIKMIIELMGK